jgi:hypothetical protein
MFVAGITRCLLDALLDSFIARLLCRWHCSVLASFVAGLLHCWDRSLPADFVADFVHCACFLAAIDRCWLALLLASFIASWFCRWLPLLPAASFVAGALLLPSLVVLHGWC